MQGRMETLIKAQMLLGIKQSNSTKSKEEGTKGKKRNEKKSFLNNYINYIVI